MIRPDLDITLLRCFLTVLDAGGFARAASLLGRTQPAVSQQIRRLEDLLGHRLIQRASPGRRRATCSSSTGATYCTTCESNFVLTGSGTACT